jgi:hypothetical protein
MTDKVKIDLQENAPYRVALDLAFEIVRNESNSRTERFKQAATDPRTYLLELYAQCRSVVIDGWSAADALKKRGG